MLLRRGSHCANVEGMSDAPNTVTVPLAQLLRDRLGLSKGYASDLATGKRTPSLELAFKIEQAIGLPVSHWKGKAA